MSGPKHGGSGMLRTRRRGVALVLVLACLFVVALVGMALLRSAANQYRQLRLERQRLQAFWLAESGVLRAAARLNGPTDYSGETWNIPAAELDGDSAGSVRIEVQMVPDQPKQRLVLVEAHFPDKADLGAVQRRRILITLPDEGVRP
jgi:type II secretory pathway component PulK